MSSSPSSTRFAVCLTRSFEILRCECPEAYLRVCSSLRPLVVNLEVDRESVALSFERERVNIRAANASADVQASTTRATIARLHDGSSTITDEILSDAVLLTGRIDDLARFHEALLDYVRGAVRCPSFPALIAAYRSR
jgi:hypothetical protein